VLGEAKVDELQQHNNTAEVTVWFQKSSNVSRDGTERKTALVLCNSGGM
jgi:hypothetical protein